jgi:hypothetical protein
MAQVPQPVTVIKAVARDVDDTLFETVHIGG